MGSAGAPLVLVFAGLDPSGGAGLLADAEAIRAMGCRPLLCATAITFQSSSRARGFEPLAPEVVEAQALALLEDEGPIGAVKLGMIGSARIAAALAKLREHPALSEIPWVIDPVLRASSGAELIEGGAATYRRLLERATVLTPNLDEAVAFDRLGAGCPGGSDLGGATAGRTGAGDTGPRDAGSASTGGTGASDAGSGGAGGIGVSDAGDADVADGSAEVHDQEHEALLALGRRLLDLGPSAILLKGGHLAGPPTDRLITREGATSLEGRRRPGTRRGTGCRLASALAAKLSLGLALQEAAAAAKSFVASYLDRGSGALSLPNELELL